MLKLKRVMNIFKFKISEYLYFQECLGLKYRISSDYFPGNSAFLFSKKAEVPSLKSSVPKLSPKASTSC